jgi:hypothetical protein
MEAKPFMLKDFFDLMPIMGGITHWQVEKSDYDFKTVRDTSRCHLKFYVENLASADFKASKENCNYLKQILMKYVFPSVVKY